MASCFLANIAPDKGLSLGFTQGICRDHKQIIWGPYLRFMTGGVYSDIMCGCGSHENPEA